MSRIRQLMEQTIKSGLRVDVFLIGVEYCSAFFVSVACFFIKPPCVQCNAMLILYVLLAVDSLCFEHPL